MPRTVVRQSQWTPIVSIVQCYFWFRQLSSNYFIFVNVYTNCLVAILSDESGLVRWPGGVICAKFLWGQMLFLTPATGNAQWTNILSLSTNWLLGEGLQFPLHCLHDASKQINLCINKYNAVNCVYIDIYYCLIVQKCLSQQAVESNLIRIIFIGIMLLICRPECRSKMLLNCLVSWSHFYICTVMCAKGKQTVC